MSMTYAQLTTNIEDICENTFTSDQIALFVQQTEQFIYNAVQIPALRKNVTGTATSGTEYLSVPTDFLYVYSLSVIDSSSNYTYLLEKEVNFIREAYPNQSTYGLPKYYSMFDGDGSSTNGNFLLGPTPDAAYNVEIHYYYDPPSIVTASTSWLGDNAETTLLYGTLYEAYTFMKGEPDVLQNYQERYKTALLNMASLGVMLKSDTYREDAA